MFRSSVVIAGFAMVVVGAGEAQARPVCDEVTVTCRHGITSGAASPASTVLGPSSPYAVSLRALDGRTLAEYLTDHQAGDRRLRRI